VARLIGSPAVWIASSHLLPESIAVTIFILVSTFSAWGVDVSSFSIFSLLHQPGFFEVTPSLV
jgi:ABC-type dipeptide/oligopeptide/nickel transport system permease subunit